MDLQRNLNSETVKRAEPAAPPCVEPATTVREVLHLLRDLQTGCAVICQDDQLLGVFTERDALNLMAQKFDWDTPIEQVMIPNPETLSETATVGQAVSKMSSGGYRRIPIIDENNKPIGLLKVSGILHYLVQHFPNLVYNLPPTPHHAPQQREGA